jgi:hypothetical protein
VWLGRAGGGRARVVERRVVAEPEPRARLVDVEELHPDARRRVAQRLVAQQRAELRIDHMDRTPQRRRVRPARRAPDERGDLRVHAVVAADRDRVRGAGDPGLREQRRIGGVAREHGDAERPRRAGVVGGRVALDGDDPVALAREPGGKPVPLLAEPEHHDVALREPQPRLLDLVAEQRRGCE